jgi:hypothetical protein
VATGTDVSAELFALIDASLEDEAPALDDNSITALREQIVRMRELKDEKTTLESQVERINGQLRELETAVREKMDALGLTSMKSPGVGTVYLATDPYPVIKDSDAFIAWLTDHGYGHLPKMSVHPSSARSWWKEQLENGGDLPPEEIASAALVKAVRMRKA